MAKNWDALFAVLDFKKKVHFSKFHSFIILGKVFVIRKFRCSEKLSVGKFFQVHMIYWYFDEDLS